MSDSTSNSAFRSRMEQVESLVAKMEASGDSAAIATARALVASVLELHAEGLARVLTLARETEPKTVDAMARDGLVGSLLLLHGLHPLDLETRVRGALDAARARFREAFEIALVGIEDGAVHVRCGRLPPGAGVATARAAIEEAIVAAAPDAASVAIDVEGEGESALIPVERLRRRAAQEATR